mmetsp:Transcript_33214/g.64862  ORF Transcript_33214/g.64862 Transcript_33214/m.64862 type:complete len:290 (+) Transcript_33214:207-1076(+)
MHLGCGERCRVDDRSRVSLGLIRFRGSHPPLAMLRQEHLGALVKVDAVGGAREAVTLVSIDHIFDLCADGMHGLDHLIRLRLLDAWVVCTLCDEQRLDNLLGVIERRGPLIQLIVNLHIPNPEREHLLHGRPIGGNGLKKRPEMRGANNVDTTAVHLRGKRKPRKRSIPPIATSQNSDTRPVRIPLLHCPLHRVRQILLHRKPPLRIPQVKPPFAVAGRCTKVYHQHSIPTVGKPLCLGVPPPPVTCPGTSVHHKHKRKGFGLQARGKGEVGHHLLSVAYRHNVTSHGG